MRRVAVLLGGVALNLLLNATAGLLGRDDAIRLTRWGWLLLALYATYLLLTEKRISQAVDRVRLKFRKPNMLSYIVVACLGAARAVLYWAAINSVFARTFLSHERVEAKKEQPPSCNLKVDSQIVARLFGEITKAPPPNVAIEARFKYKELFYEWSVMVAPEQEMSEISITVDYLQPDDRINTIPDAASVSDLRPRWVSGFEENRSPDHYAKIFKFTSLSKERTSRIVVRRLLNQLAVNNNSLGEPHIIRVTDVAANACRIELPKIDPVNEAKRLSVHLATLTKWDGGRSDN